MITAQRSALAVTLSFTILISGCGVGNLTPQPPAESVTVWLVRVSEGIGVFLTQLYALNDAGIIDDALTLRLEDAIDTVAVAGIKATDLVEALYQAGERENFLDAVVILEAAVASVITALPDGERVAQLRAAILLIQIATASVRQVAIAAVGP